MASQNKLPVIKLTDVKYIKNSLKNNISVYCTYCAYVLQNKWIGLPQSVCGQRGDPLFPYQFRGMSYQLHLLPYYLKLLYKKYFMITNKQLLTVILNN